MDATTLPTLLLGGEPSGRPRATYAALGPLARAARRARPGRRPLAALPARTATWPPRSTSPPTSCTVAEHEHRRRQRDLGAPAGHADDGEFQVAVTPPPPTPCPAGAHPPAGRYDLHAGGARRPRPGDEETLVLPLAGAFRVEVTEADGTAYDVTARRARVRLRRADRLRLRRPRATLRVTLERPDAAASPCAAPAASKAPSPGVPAPRGSRGPGRAARRRPGQPRRCSNFGTARRPSTPTAHRLRGAHARRQLVLVPAAQARRGAPRRGVRARGDLLLRESTDPRGTDPVGYQRVYGTSAHGPIDVLAEVRTGDVVLVPHGWHGPSIAGPGYDLYYLNVMAGPGPERAWLICDDPAHAWVRDTWAGPATSTPGCPLTRPRDQRMTTHERVRLTVAQALVRFLAAPVQRARRRAAPALRRLLRASSATATSPASARRCSRTSCGHRRRRSPACRTSSGRNEQAMVHTAVAYARQHDRLLDLRRAPPRSAPARPTCSPARRWPPSTGCPVLLLPGDIFATRVSAPVLQELERPHAGDVTVNDAFRPVSRFFDRIWRPEQLPAGRCSAPCGCSPTRSRPAR